MSGSEYAIPFSTIGLFRFDSIFFSNDYMCAYFNLVIVAILVLNICVINPFATAF